MNYNVLNNLKQNLMLRKLMKQTKKLIGEFLGGLAVKEPRHCRGSGSVPGLGISVYATGTAGKKKNPTGIS